MYLQKAWKNFDHWNTGCGQLVHLQSLPDSNTALNSPKGSEVVMKDLYQTA
jgi:hypothetical protein